MNNTFNISRFCKFFCMELRQYRKLFLILMGVTLIDLAMSMASFSATHQMIVDANIEELGIENSTITNMVHQAKLGVNPIQFGGAFGFLLLIIPFLLYNFVYHPTKSFTYSMLPASWLEKFTSAWVMCVIAVPLMLFAFALLVAFIGDLFGAQITYHTLLDPKSFFTNIYFPTIAAQSVMFWGAFWFKRQKVGKTILTIVLLVIAVSMIFVKFDTKNFIEKIIWLSTIGDSYLFAYVPVILLWTLALIKFPRTQI